jgi:GT2 family glycosyltransferase
VWKHGDQVKNAVESIRKYEPSTFFIFVDNDADQDVKEVIKNVDGAEIIQNSTNCLVNYAWNQGLNRAIDLKFQLVILANSDILLQSDLSIPKQLSVDGRLGTYVPRDGIKNWEYLGDNEHLPGYFMMFPTELLPKVLPIPSGLRLWFGDNYLEARLRKLGYPVYSVNVVVAHVEGGSQNIRELKRFKEISDADKLAWEQLSIDYGIVGRL